MAIIKLGMLVTGIRGTVGGTIYSANKSGPFARGWSKGSNPRTTSQTGERAIISSHPVEWRAITQGQRDSWDTYAAHPAQQLTNPLGETYFASGFNWFCRINTHLVLSSRARRSDPPVGATPVMPILGPSFCFTPISVDFHNRITYTFPQFLDSDVIVRVALYPRKTLLWKSRGYRGVHYTTRTTTTYTEFGLTTLGIFGQPPSGGKCFFQVQRQNTHGRRSAVVTSTVDIVTL